MWKTVKASLAIVILLFVALTALILMNHSDEKTSVKNSGPFADVKRYQPLIKEELAKYRLEKYTNVLLALMHQESRGEGGDPMQASESAGLSPNEIKNPKQSIEKGVKHFRRMLIYGEQNHVDFPTVIQAYNMGAGYIDFVKKHGGKHTEQLAKEFSIIQVRKEPKVYNCGGNKDNFRYPYCYGDFTYSTKVEEHIKSLST
ncbi:soluble lytic murein transglycosylase-like protein [Scopulibacillus daqui]|uniref:Soluble lytic murein transglycosylase-like protein n=1 Tax=Scopulibacillus daqui TaxID=1469162 RepID=A0ABS2PVL4_9BACL|nr:lysozyme family protein [Scopulibacillus daqui]MBM7644099.1 soluble lytic murein transglycosylase-like protein [Scopulibacillus daqui]